MSAPENKIARQRKFSLQNSRSYDLYTVSRHSVDMRAAHGKTQPQLTPLTPVAVRPLSDLVTDQIVDAIALRRLLPGERLVETDLSALLGVSRAPVREALRTLQGQGVVVAAPRRGLVVGPFDAAWATQLRLARLSLERQAAVIACERLRADSARMDLIDTAIDDLDRARGDWLAVNKADIAFHAAIFEIAASPLLLALWRAIARHVLILFGHEVVDNPEFEPVLAEHHHYRDLLAQNRTDELAHEIAHHVAGHPTRSRPYPITTDQGE